MSGAGKSAENSAWVRLGVLVREARKALGYSSFEAFAEACGFSARVASAIEAGERTNYSVPTLERLETGLGWSSGTVQRVLSEPDFDPATTTAQLGVGMLFRPPHFDPGPVPVAVDSVIEVCGALDQAAASVRAAKSSRSSGSDELRQLAAAVLPVCWMHILRVLEKNCLPGEHLHPAARPSYDAFVKIQEVFTAPSGSDIGAYAQWLVGDRTGVGKADRDRYYKRWVASAQPASEDETPITAGGGLFRPLRFDDSPVMVDVDVIVRVIEVLSAIAEAHGLGKSTTTDAEADRRDNPSLWLLAASSLRLCWPYVIRLVEDNVTPGIEVNPAVDQQYTAFRDMQMFFAPDDRTGVYTQWLTGDLDDIDDKTRQRYLQRWHESRNRRRTAKRAD